jgi:hypothetical protein
MARLQKSTALLKFVVSSGTYANGQIDQPWVATALTTAPLEGVG